MSSMSPKSKTKFGRASLSDQPQFHKPPTTSMARLSSFQLEDDDGNGEYGETADNVSSRTWTSRPQVIIHVNSNTPAAETQSPAEEPHPRRVSKRKSNAALTLPLLPAEKHTVSEEPPLRRVSKRKSDAAPAPTLPPAERQSPAEEPTSRRVPPKRISNEGRHSTVPPTKNLEAPLQEVLSKRKSDRAPTPTLPPAKKRTTKPETVPKSKAIDEGPTPKAAPRGKTQAPTLKLVMSTAITKVTEEAVSSIAPRYKTRALLTAKDSHNEPAPKVAPKPKTKAPARQSTAGLGGTEEDTACKLKAKAKTMSAAKATEPPVKKRKESDEQPTLKESPQPKSKPPTKEPATSSAKPKDTREDAMSIPLARINAPAKHPASSSAESNIAEEETTSKSKADDASMVKGTLSSTVASKRKPTTSVQETVSSAAARGNPGKFILNTRPPTSHSAVPSAASMAAQKAAFRKSVV